MNSHLFVTKLLILFCCITSSVLWAMEKKEGSPGLITIEDIYGGKQSVRFFQKSMNGQEEQLISGAIYFHDGTHEELNDMPFGKFKKLIGLNQMFLSSDELPLDEEKRVEQLNKSIPNQTDTVKLHTKLNEIQRQLDRLRKDVAAARSEEGRHEVSGEFMHIMKKLEPMISGYPQINGSEDEVAYQLAKALSLYVLAEKGYDNSNVALYFIDRQTNIQNRLKKIDVAPWFNELRRFFLKLAPKKAEK